MAMTEEHKAALARGREEARAIKAYLTALNSRRPGRPVTEESLKKRLRSVSQKLDNEDNPLNQVELLQKKLDLEEGLSRLDEGPDFDEVEREFVRHVKRYSERKGISYTAWRDFGVPAATLRQGGVPETRRR